MSFSGGDHEDELDRVFNQNMTSAEVSSTYRFYCEMIYKSLIKGELSAVQNSLEKLLGPEMVAQIRGALTGGVVH